MQEQRDPQLPGFQRLTKKSKPQLSPEQRTGLIRRGNELYNNGRVTDAKRIFITASYTDGLIRMGNYHLKRNEPLEAFRMFWQAGAKREIDSMAERMAGVLKQWLADDDGNNGNT